MIILGIETSCDETAAAIVTGDGQILANIVLSQFEDHRAYGGVVPEIAARAHLEHLDRLIAAALAHAGIGVSDLDGVAATCGPGLVGGLLVGMMAGKAIAAARGIPFMAVNHLEGHALTPRLTDGIAFPYLVLLVSGGHTQILVAEGVGRYRRWGTTLDDAAGECFDKAAKLMGLPWPGGPHIEKLAQHCTDAAAQQRFVFPRPMKGRKDMDFSFSGLKTAVRLAVESLPDGQNPGEIAAEDAAALAWALQDAVADVLQDRCARALQQFVQHYPAAKPVLVVSGGVAANAAIRSKLAALAQQNRATLCAPPLNLCTDNAAMIAWAGAERLRAGLTDGMDAKARPRWPLDPDATPRHGAGVKA